MSGSLVKRDQPQGSRALELLSRGFGGLENKGALIKALLPNLPQVRLPFNKPPPNIIRVIIDQDGGKSLGPGERIMGTIRLMASEPIAVEEITVSLIGIAKTKVLRSMGQTPKTVYRSNIVFLNDTLEIEPESSILTPKRYEWPFQFELPRICTIKELPFDERTRRFNDNLTQPLPPTFADRGKETIEAITAKCSIEYHVTAKLVSKRERQKDIHHKAPISVFLNDALTIAASEADTRLTKRCTFKFRSVMLSSPMASPPGTPIDSPSSNEKPMKEPSSPSLGTRFKNSFMPFTLPSFSFDLDADLPRSGRLSEPLPISIRLFWHTSSSSTGIPKAPTPPITLTAVTINLLSKTLLRAMPEDLNLGSSFVIATGSIHQTWRSKPVIVAQLKTPIDSIPETLDLSKHLFVRPHHFQPAFKTYNIAREYVLQVVCNLECVGELFEARYEVEGFTIVAGGGVDDDFEERRRLDREEREKEEEAFRELDSDEEDTNVDEEEQPPEMAENAVTAAASP